LDGKNIAPCLMENAPSPHQSLYWQNGNQWAVRKGDWKLYANAQDPSSSQPVPGADAKLLLVNLLDDPGERTNLAEQQKERVEELRLLRREYEARVKQNTL
jgi:arylsulfatase A-like enzyme